MARLSIISIVLCLFVSVWTTTLNIEGSSKRLLVLLDNLGLRESHSFYFKQLKGERILNLIYDKYLFIYRSWI
jgi:hypothetical protein